MENISLDKYIELVETDEEINDIVTISSIVWPFTYKNILSNDQIKYMLNLFLSPKAIKKSMKDGYRYLLLLSEDKNKMGYVSFKFDDDGIYISKIYLLPNFQHKGILEKVIKNLSYFGKTITLNVNKHNTAAIKAYEKYGFKKIKSVVNDIGNGYVMDDYVMALEVK
ncbi:MAG: GNAT family N-acetyltransferase [Acholeplasmatales bacterium]|nr:GNAT family N-acetyltransferase [Acholeplasmatales bacterium]